MERGLGRALAQPMIGLEFKQYHQKANKTTKKQTKEEYT
jgi:hypothetical protein